MGDEALGVSRAVVCGKEKYENVKVWECPSS